MTISIDNDIASEFYTVIYDTNKNSVLLVADEVSFSGGLYTKGWINGNEFYIVNNKNLIIYNLNGQKTIIINSDNKYETIHGFSASSNGKYAIFYSDGNTKNIYLLVYTDLNGEPMNLGIVDNQEYQEGSESYPMQITLSKWDDTDKNIAFTKSIYYQGAVINLDTHLICELKESRNIKGINYDIYKKRFEFLGDKEFYYYP